REEQRRMPGRGCVYIRLAQRDVATTKRQRAGIVRRDPVFIDVPIYEAVVLGDRYFVPCEAKGAGLCLASLGVGCIAAVFGRRYRQLNRWRAYRGEQRRIIRVRVGVRACGHCRSWSDRARLRINAIVIRDTAVSRRGESNSVHRGGRSGEAGVTND